MEINLEVRDEGPCTSIPTRRRDRSGVAYFLRRIWAKVAVFILDSLIVAGFFVSITCWILREEFEEFIGRVREPIGRAWGKVRPIIFMAAEKWERAFVVSCIAVSLDPLFLYIPIVDETNKCLAMDKNLKPIALILRSLTDFLLITHIIAQIFKWVRTDYPNYSEHSSGLDEFDPDPKALNPVEKLVKHTLPWSIIIKLLAVLPVPQVGILVGFFRLRGSDFLVNRKFLNVSLVLQYLPRVCQIYLIKSEFRMAGKWVNPSFNLFLYILASHVLGASWYFFAIERETSCWYKACREARGCVASSYNCGGRGNGSAKNNITFLDQLCPINSPNSTLFDFGIFVKILQSGNTGSDKFVTKLFYSSWWGLKNLSNFGMNLETSSYLWENCFAILICVIGLLLFLYLIGNVQLYIQSSTQQLLDKEKLRTESIENKKVDITNWMKDKFLHDDEKRKRIKRYIREDKVVEKNLSHHVDVVVDVKYFLNPSVTFRIRKRILKHLGLPNLKEVLQQYAIDETKLKSLCRSMEPVVYDRNSEVVGPTTEKWEKMLFIIEGQLISSDDSSRTRKKNEYYGDYILEWALRNYKTKYRYDPVPSPTGTFVSGSAKVEALSLDAWKLLYFIEETVDINSPELTGYLKTDWVNTEDPLPRNSTVQWNSPDRGSVKLNCASLWDPKSKTALLGGILGDDGGALIEAGLSLQPCIDEFEAAAYSIKNYIKFHPRFVSTNIVVESDDNLLVECLNSWSTLSNERVRRRLRPILENIMRVAKRFKSYTFVHCERQTNAAAILLAKHADAEPNHGSSKTWKAHESIRQWLATVLKEDSPPPKVPNKEPDPKEQTQKPVAKVQKQEPVPKEQNQELVAKDSEAAPDELKTPKQPLASLLKNT